MRFLACLLLLALLPAAKPTVSPSPLSQPTVADSQPYRITSDIRLKRMYLMRPDLIGYPIIQDYYA